MPTAAPEAVPVSPQRVGRLSSDSVPVGGFTPGAIMADRYRIIGLLGRGGMGEVYRADDLKLGQPVALKFLPKALASDPVRRERFFAEVRITRQLAHPNICRVYDIEEFDGQHFLSMEYIDGEDLASLIKRIGYLSNQKALEITRQLVAGLAAAHDRGVLHRDLKPANIMIDGHGRVRITDFGLAIAAEDESQAVEMFGTPAYMAPEQFAGKGASVRSDIYALGMILYEIYCGKRTFTALTIAELREQKEGLAPTAPSEIRQGIDPIVERLIMRCLERDPRNRPASVAQLAVALPGGDPLAAALAAGETPSPEMVAASGLKEGVRPAVAWSLLAFVILGSLAVALLNKRTMITERVPPGKSPDFLAERARQLIAKAGYSDAPQDSAFGYSYYGDLLRYIQNNYKTSDRWNRLAAYNPVVFEYRQSPRPLERTGFLFGDYGSSLTATLIPLQYSGDVLMRLDGEGRLRTLDAIPPQVVSSAGPAPTTDWAAFFSEAGFDLSKWTPVEHQWNPPYYADTAAAWQGSLPYAPEIPVRIEAAAYRGKPVHFEIIGPWTRPEREAPFVRQPGETIVNAIFAMMLMTLIGGGLFFARRNLRLGRGDRRGATRLAVFLLILLTVSWVLGEHHVATFWEVGLFIMYLSFTLFLVVLFWILYIALEPFVRRRWPQILVTWTRLLSGDWHDPLVGRDLLIGCAAGIAVILCIQSAIVAPAWFGHPEGKLGEAYLNATGVRLFVSRLISDIAIAGLMQGLGVLFVLFLLRVLLRRDWLAAIASILIFTATQVFQAESRWIVLPILFLSFALYFFVLMRVGLVSSIVAIIAVVALGQDFPVTFQASAWYSSAGYATAALIVSLAIYGFRNSLGGNPLLDLSRVED
jgi:Protein kinase domain